MQQPASNVKLLQANWYLLQADCELLQANYRLLELITNCCERIASFPQSAASKLRNVAFVSNQFQLEVQARKSH